MKLILSVWNFKKSSVDKILWDIVIPGLIFSAIVGNKRILRGYRMIGPTTESLL